MTSRLFHFSDDNSIEIFEPRPVLVPSPRPTGKEWLNGPLVWAIDEWHQPMYLFPRDCPRILVWRREGSTGHDVERLMGGSPARIVAFIERTWFSSLASQTLYRYELPRSNFACLCDAGMWVAKGRVKPIGMSVVSDLPSRLAETDVELRLLDSILSLRDAWSSSLHVSGIRLRNAVGR
jgi:hypothetical protein